MSGPVRVGGAAQSLGFAGLLPQGAALAGVVWGGPDWVAYAIVVAIAYAAIILSFLGGIWWGIAMGRRVGQTRLAVLAIAPSLWVFATMLGMLAAGKAGVVVELYYAWGATALAAALLATIAVDARLERSGEAPAGWTGFRVRLSVGLALLTAAAGWAYAAITRTETWV